MSFPGPTGVVWALGLLLFAAAFLPAGEVLRRLAARWASLFRADDLLERGLLDLYLGGAGLYVLAEVPARLFYPSTVFGYMAGGAIAWLIWVIRERRRPTTAGTALFRPASGPRLPGWLLGLTALSLFALEVAAAEPIPTGNTFDSSILADFVSLLNLHHQVPTSFVPFAAQFTAYPQGTTVWLASAQTLFGLPAARTSLLVTPLFLALAPIGAYAWGRRAFDSRWAGLAFGVTFALLGSWTRVLVGGSNDFAFAFPLVLWLFGRCDVWTRPPVIGWANAVGFGALVGYSAALNPVGAEWLFPTILAVGMLVLPRSGIRFRHWLSRWGVAVATGLLFVLHSLYVIAFGHGNPLPAASTPPPSGLPPPGITGAQFLGSIDPYLFGPRDVWMSPFALLRLELAVLLFAGLTLLVVPVLFERLGVAARAFRRWTAAGFAVAVALLGIEVLSGAGVAGLGFVPTVAAAGEVSILLFALYTAIGAVPLFWVMAEAGIFHDPRDPAATSVAAGPSAMTGPGGHGSVARWTPERIGALVLAVAIVVPGVGVTGTALPAYLDNLYGSFSRVTPADFDLLAWAEAHLPAGASVLAAPGSAAQFLPGYDPSVRLLFPVQPIATNGSYVDLVRALDLGALSNRSYADLATLGVGYVAVTGNNTDLWAPFSPAPMLGAPSAFVLVFHEADAYLFEWTGRTA